MSRHYRQNEYDAGGLGGLLGCIIAIGGLAALFMAALYICFQFGCWIARLVF